MGRRRVEGFLLGLDRQPRQIRVRTVLTRVTRDGEGREVRTVLSQPTLFLEDGKTGVIMSGAARGESVEVQVTATVIDPPGGERK